MRRFLCAVLAVLATSAGTAAESERLPFAVAIQVERGPRAVPGTFLQEVHEALWLELKERGCFEGVERDPGSAMLLVRLLLDDVVEETRYDLGIADRVRTQDPEADRAFVCTFDVHCGVELEVLPGRQPVRTKRFRTTTDRRPVASGEDAAAEARSAAIAQVAREARAAVCKGSRAKLLQQIEAARAAEPPAR